MRVRFRARLTRSTEKPGKSTMRSTVSPSSCTSCSGGWGVYGAFCIWSIAAATSQWGWVSTFWANMAISRS